MRGGVGWRGVRGSQARWAGGRARAWAEGGRWVDAVGWERERTRPTCRRRTLAPHYAPPPPHPTTPPPPLHPPGLVEQVKAKDGGVVLPREASERVLAVEQVVEVVLDHLLGGAVGPEFVRLGGKGRVEGCRAGRGWARARARRVGQAWLPAGTRRHPSTLHRLLSLSSSISRLGLGQAGPLDVGGLAVADVGGQPVVDGHKQHAHATRPRDGDDVVQALACNCLGQGLGLGSNVWSGIGLGCPGGGGQHGLPPASPSMCACHGEREGRGTRRPAQRSRQAGGRRSGVPVPERHHTARRGTPPHSPMDSSYTPGDFCHMNDVSSP